VLAILDTLLDVIFTKCIIEAWAVPYAKFNFCLNFLLIGLLSPHFSSVQAASASRFLTGSYSRLCSLPKYCGRWRRMDCPLVNIVDDFKQKQNEPNMFEFQ
jgi:hypothetical protein